MIRPLFQNAVRGIKQIPEFCISANNVVRTRMLALVREMCDRPLRLLDLGCGNCWMWEEFLKKVPEVDFYGVDPNPKSIKEARKRLNSFAKQIRIGGIQDLPEIFQGTRFDVVVSHSVLEHVYKRRVFFRNLALCLKEGGVVLLSYGNDHFRQSLIVDLRNLASQLLAHIGVYKYYAKPVSVQAVERLCRDSDLEIIEKAFFSYIPVKKIGKLVSSTKGKKEFCLLWGALEEKLNMDIKSGFELEDVMDETFFVLKKRS